MDPGALTASTSRSAALAGADVAIAGGAPLSAGSVADLARLEGPATLGTGGLATAGGGSAVSVAGGVPVEGIGLATGVTQRVRGDAAERSFGLAAGSPVGGVPGLSVGLGLKGLAASQGGSSAAGFAVDFGATGRFGLRWQGVEVAAAAAVENALGVLTWDSGLKEDVPSRARIGLGVFRGPVALVTGVTLVRGPAGRGHVWAAGVEHAFAIGDMPGGLTGAARAGWRDGAACAGFGAAWGPVSLDYALAVARHSLLNSVSVEWRLPGTGFGTPPASAPRRAGSSAAASAGGAAAVRTAEAVPESDVLALDSPYRTLSFRVRVPADERARAWVVLVIAPSGAVVWEVTGESEPPATVTWNGASLAGDPVEAGTYVVRLMLRGGSVPVYLSRGKPFRVTAPPVRPPARGAGGFDEGEGPAGGRP